MIYLLFTVLLTEMALVVTLSFRNPLRKLVISLLDKLKQGRGPIVAKTVGATILVVFLSAVYSALDIQRRSKEGSMINPTDAVLMSHLLLLASLMGFSLFLALIADRLHYYIKEIHLLRMRLEEAST
ncbi:B-cell receptor-associated 31-like [Melia azedarach]|uniref:B-cell receptor-associated 31-like n=2 Tax=Melia azedarach TaxID=155640 RepID=A0ACC1YP17_MELAZ|nr:B-cell receptor-associated 31-like [Melia azedarach]